MIFKTQWKTIMAAFVLVLLAAAMFATPVFAEGETPPPEPPATEGAIEEETPPANPPEIEEPAEEAPELEQPAAPEEIASPDPQLQPAGETDEEGSGTGAPDEPVTEVQPLAGIYENSLSDPYFNCTDDTVDGTNDGVCRYTNPVTGLQEAVTDYATRGGYGYINVEDGLLYTATGDITINAAPKLTGIRGTGSSLVTWTFDPAYRLAIENMASGFLLSGITIVGNDIDELVHFSGNGGTLTIDDVTIENTGGDGLKIEDHSGAIVLKDVKANNNGGAGASLDNAAGSSSVTVTNGAFNGNGQAGNAVGLEIITDGKATLNGVSASGNKGDGVRILAAQGIAVTNAVMNDNIEDPADPGIFGYGLYVDPATKGSLSLTGVLASGNAADGLRLGTNSSITLKNVNANNSLAGSGLRICNAGCDAPGATTVTLTGVSEFSNNALSGAVIKASGSVTIYRARFMNNLAPTADEDYALFVQTPGTIKLYSVVSQGNNYGVLLDNDLAGATGSVYLYNNYGDNHFDGSISGHGIQVKSNGTVYMKGVYASDNLLDGINIANDETGRTGSVSLYDVFAYGNDQEGIDVVSNGVIKLSGVAAGGNVHQGASLKNDTSGGSPSVSVSNSYFNGNTGSGGANDSDGLYIFTKGSVTVTNVHASDNEENGVYIYNLADLLPSSVSVRCTTAEACQFNNNGGNGLFIYANGKVTLSNLALNDNDVNGGYIDNVGNSQGYPLALINLNAHNNGQRGFLFTTSGSVSLTNINADGNGFFGVDIDADQGYGTVTIKRTIAGWNSFNDNGTQDGLVINALNTIVLQKIQANGNGRYGANLNNCRQQVVNGPCTGLGGITVSGTSTNPNQFNQNGILGLNAVSSGTVTITNINADENGFSGAEVVNYYSNAAGNVSITASGGFTNTFDRNLGIRQQDEANAALYAAEWAHGLGIFTNGAVTLRNLSANENHGAGAYITNYGEAPRYRPVSIMYADFNDNTNGDGLYVTSLAPVTVKFVNASGNDGQDLAIPATFDGSGGGTAALAVERIVDRTTDPEADLWNFRIGDALTPNLFIVVNATESVTATLQKYDTGTTSWQVVATETGAGIQMDFDGIEYAIQSEGLYRVIIAETTNTTVEYTLVLKENAASNPTSPGRTGANGLDLNTFYGGINGAVTIYGIAPYGGAFDDNASTGVLVYAFGAISTRDLHASGNGLFGARLENYSAVQPVTVNGYANTFEGNQGSGLYIISARAVNLYNIAANGNGGNDLSTAIYRRYGIEVQTYEQGSTIQLKTTRSGFRNSVNGNYFGLGFYTTGSATIQNTDVENNTGSGAFIKYSSGTPLLGKVTVTNSDFIGNGTYGLDMLTGSKVYLDKVNASDNSNFGIRLYNDQTNALVSIKRGIFERNNTGYGLEVRVLGVITVDSVQVNGNADKGAILDNQEVGQTGSVTLKASYWTNRFLENAGGAGLEVLSNGAIKLYTLEASRNGAAGLLLESAVSTVYVKDAQLKGNTGSGIQTTSLGDTWLYYITSQGNGGNGAYLTSDGGTIRVYSSAFGYNTGNGLWLDIPAIANYYLSNVTYYGNGLEDRKIDVTP